MASSTPQFYSFKTGVNDHFFFGPNNNKLAVTQEKEIQIFDVVNDTKKLTHTLTGHDETITAIDVSKDGLIVSASQDRNAIVWKPLPDGTYKKDLVLLRINRSATCVKWSPFGNKFAVGSGSKIISVCYYEPENDWWISKHLKKPFRSTILSIEWHPNNILLAVGTLDFNAYVVSGYVKGIDEKPPASGWGSKLPFNTICGNFISSPGGWVHDVAFSPSGEVLAFISNDSTITVVYPKETEGEFDVTSVKTNYLPFKTVKFIGENELIVAGHNCFPVVYQGTQEGWRESRSLDNTKRPTAKTLDNSTTGGNEDEDEENTTGTSALSMFRQLDLKGKIANKGSTELPTVHQNTITSLRTFDAKHVSTSGNDGKVVIFPI